VKFGEMTDHSVVYTLYMQLLLYVMSCKHGNDEVLYGYIQRIQLIENPHLSNNFFV